MNKQSAKQLFKIVMILISIFCTWFFTWEFVSVWIKPLPETVQEEIDNAPNYGFDGMIVYVDQAGKTPAFYASGWKDRDNKIPADPKSLFKIASISKLYVAVSVAKLVYNKQLDLNKTLAEYFPKLVGRIEHAETITLRTMVQHRSGIPNFTDNPKYWQDGDEVRKEALEYALDLPASFEPGEDYGYSNTNYLLLRRLIDRVLGYSHYQYIREEILQPLGLKNTYCSLNEVNINDVMSGYYVGMDIDFKTENTGLMLATAEDVGHFLRALNEGSVFNEGEEDIYSSIYVYEHTGLLPGYQSIAKYHKDIDAVVIQFVNTSNFEGHTWFISEIVYDRIMKIIKRK